MTDQNKFVQAPKLYLSGSGVSSTATSVQVTQLVKPGTTTTIAMTDFGSTGYATMEPGTAREENISFTGITQNADGSATLTGVTRGLDFVSPYSSTAALKHAHAGGTSLVISNSAPFYDEMAAKDNDETVTGTWTFSNTARPKLDTDAVTATDEEFVTYGQLYATSISGATNGDSTHKGIFEGAVISEAASSAAAGSGDTDADLAITASLCGNTSSAKQMIPVTDADGDIPVEFMELDANWAFTGDNSFAGVHNISTATNWQLGGVAYTGTMADLNEAETFFGLTDMTGTEAEELTDGSTTSLHDHASKFEILPSADVIASADTERTDGASETDYVKVKEMTIGFAGEYRFTWDMKVSGGSATAYGRVYRNGVAVGTEKTTTNTVYVAQSDDISGWSIGDKAQLYIKDEDSGENVTIRNFRLQGTVVPIVTVDID